MYGKKNSKKWIFDPVFKPYLSKKRIFCLIFVPIYKMGQIFYFVTPQWWDFHICLLASGQISFFCQSKNVKNRLKHVWEPCFLGLYFLSLRSDEKCWFFAIFTNWSGKGLRLCLIIWFSINFFSSYHTKTWKVIQKCRLNALWLEKWPKR